MKLCQHGQARRPLESIGGKDIEVQVKALEAFTCYISALISKEYEAQ